MAARGGRGRGWRGGRGGGRGGVQMPALRDDEGNLVDREETTGPPPLFPALELHHDPPEPSAHDQLLLLRRADLLGYYKNSPYYIQPKPDKAAKANVGDGVDEVERYSDRHRKKVKPAQQKVPLASLLTLHPHHFPVELFTDKDKRLAGKGGVDLFRKQPAPGEEASLLTKRLDNLNKLEEQDPVTAGKPGAAAAATAAGGAGYQQKRQLP
eukprot:GHRR01012566.1.p1 GENE.GHRR01012566.1~~GHRR01012566.1.p1  ORF type:complete len:211 (+),score=73.31 GHRR01012566.1:1179-1811(+)